MGQVVLRFRKVKGSTDLGNVANHNSRAKVLDETGGFKGDPPEWMKNPLRINLNEGQQGKRDDSIVKAWHRTVSEAGLKRKPQSNAAMGVEGIFTATKGTFKTASEWKKYLHEGLEFLDKKFGHDNILQWNMHFDETTPHLHVIFAPIVRDPVKGNRYSSGHFLGGPEGLRELQSEVSEKVGKKYGLERGVPGSEKKHTDQSEWKSELVKKEKELDKREELIKLKENDLNKVAKGLLKTEGEKTVGSIINVFRNEVIQTPEINKFWPEFFKCLPSFVTQIVQDVRRGLAEDRAAARNLQNQNAKNISRSR